MELRDLPDRKWKRHEENRFLNDDTKAKTESFDPEAFKHDGFSDRKKYVEEYVPALADEERLEAELDDFTPPRLSSINSSPYQALVIRYAVLRTLIKQLDYKMEKEKLLNDVQSWQHDIIESFDGDSFPEDDDLLHLARACVDYKSEIDDSELHLVHSYFKLHNEAQDRKHSYYTWLDFFKRLSAIDRFPKVSRSDKPQHATDTIEKGVWSLQEQAIVYEVVDSDGNDVVGIPEDYVEYIRGWLNYEMSYDNYLNMLGEIEFFDHQDNLIETRKKFGLNTSSRTNQGRRENIAKAGVFPSELLSEMLNNEQLQEIIDEYGLDADKRRNADMINKIIDYFEHSQKYESAESDVELYLQSFGEISDGNVERVPPQIQKVVGEEEDVSKKMDMLFEEATAEIFKEAFNLDGTNLKGYTATGTVPDGEVEQDGRWLLWDNKRRADKFKLDSNTRSKIKNYIDTKNQQHDVEWFLIIAPDYADSAEKNAIKLEHQLGVDIRMIRADDFRSLAEFWRESFDEDGRELPLSVFYGSGEVDLEPVKETLEEQFS